MNEDETSASRRWARERAPLLTALLILGMALAVLIVINVLRG